MDSLCAFPGTVDPDEDDQKEDVPVGVVVQVEVEVSKTKTGNIRRPTKRSPYLFSHHGEK